MKKYCIVFFSVYVFSSNAKHVIGCCSKRWPKSLAAEKSILVGNFTNAVNTLQGQSHQIFLRLLGLYGLISAKINTSTSS
jgi:hypothetical protein